MPERIAIKVMTISDLTFFQAHFKQRNTASKQKCINLNADVFAKQFYEDFAEAAVGEAVEVAVSVTVHGPRVGKPYKFTRSITKKGPGYKNWRLNGETVRDPDDESGRFDHIGTGDLAIMEFHGAAFPVAVDLVVVSASDDLSLHGLLTKEAVQNSKSMAVISRRRLTEIAIDARVGPDHPIQVLLKDAERDELLEIAETGAESAIKRLRSRGGRKPTKAELAAARERREKIGADGEYLANALLEKLTSAGQFRKVSWVSEEDLLSPWDFEAEASDGSVIRLDAKSTKGKHDTGFFMGEAEVIAATDPHIPYRIIRLSDLGDAGASVTISDNINELAKKILDGTRSLPGGVTAPQFCLQPSALKWGSVEYVERPEESE